MKNVLIYSTPTCPYCHLAKEFLKENKIKYEDVNVQENDKALQEMVKKSGQYGVPVIDVDGEIIVGFDKERLSKAVGL